MDLDMLEILLNDTSTYQDTTKAIFLEKTNKAFQEMRSCMDTELIAFKGVCDSKGCSNKGCKGYSFMGNLSGKHIDLIFYEGETDFKDIYHSMDYKLLSDRLIQ